MDAYIIFVEPQFTGNIGFLARTMMNFGFEKMILINPPEFDDDTYRFSKHARHVVENALILHDFKDVRKYVDYLVATSGVDTASPKKFKRISHTPREMAEKLSGVDGRIGIAFGRENYGLYNEEIEQCDALVTIPTNPAYPIMNITHAAAVVLYEIYVHSAEERNMPIAESSEIELLNEKFSTILTAINFPEHKRKNTEVMFRRLMGRAVMTKWEYHAMMGVFNRILYAVRHNKV
ncbi:MAG: RNA methyltransferase [Euryarchaeota archaeon]|nr:RNA methyltransferase [Euryarchaeota archaeon]